MKINAKLGGRNLKLYGELRATFPNRIDARPFMILGAANFYYQKRTHFLNF